MIQKCNRCNGKGYFPFDLGIGVADTTCQVCNGKGYVNVSENSGNVPEESGEKNDSADTKA